MWFAKWIRKFGIFRQFFEQRNEARFARKLRKKRHTYLKVNQTIYFLSMMVFQLSQVTMIIYCPEPERYRKCGKIRWRTHSFSLLLSVIGELEKPLNESPNHNSGVESQIFTWSQVDYTGTWWVWWGA